MENSEHNNKVESFLPPSNRHLTLSGLVKGYAEWWCSLPSISGYQRYSSVDERHLFVWEGYPGSYDHYGDFADDDAFYNESVKSYCCFWRIRKLDGYFQITRTNYSAYFELPVAERRAAWQKHGDCNHKSVKFDCGYRTLKDLRTAMITQWGDGYPDLGEQGEPLRQFIETHNQPLLALLNSMGANWVSESPEENRGYQVLELDTYKFLSLWQSKHNSHEVTNSPIVQINGKYPEVNRNRVKQYAELRVGMKRIPIRFHLQMRQWGQYSLYRDTALGTNSLRSFGALEKAIDYAMKNLDFSSRPI